MDNDIFYPKPKSNEYVLEQVAPENILEVLTKGSPQKKASTKKEEVKKRRL